MAFAGKSGGNRAQTQETLAVAAPGGFSTRPSQLLKDDTDHVCYTDALS